jgi:hypothetical protein
VTNYRHRVLTNYKARFVLNIINGNASIDNLMPENSISRPIFNILGQNGNAKEPIFLHSRTPDPKPATAFVPQASLSPSSDEDFFELAFEGAIDESADAVLGIIGFRAGTHIRTTRGLVAIDNLTPGDQIITAAGAIRSISRIERHWTAEKAIGMPSIRLAEGALAERIPTRDLWVSPRQALFIDGMLVPAGDLVNDVSITRLYSAEPVAYFHLVLDIPDFVLAEDAQAAGFAGISTGTPEASPAALGVIRQRIARRAGIHSASDGVPGVLRGYLEDCSPGRIAGWAQDMLEVDAPVRVAIMLDGVTLGEIAANAWRPDLAKAGIGRGDHGFDFCPAEPIPLHRLGAIKVIRVADRAELPRVFGLASPD